jgi:hypothetical protein
MASLSAYNNISMANKQATTSGRWRDDTSISSLYFLSSFSQLSKPIAVGKYGGRKDVTLDATGFYYLTSYPNNRQYFIDPEGHPFISLGHNSVNPADLNVPSRKEAFKPYNDLWIEATINDIQSGNFNTLGSFTDYEYFVEAQKNIPYMPELSLMISYRYYRRANLYPYNDDNSKGKPQAFYPWDPEFPGWLDSHIQNSPICSMRLSADPYLIGYFVENELPMSSSFLSVCLNFPANDPTYQAAQTFVDGLGRIPTQDDSNRFCGQAFLKFYEIVVEAIKKYDPNHLILGSKQQYSSNQYVLSASCQYTDVYSINYYSKWSPSQSHSDNIRTFSNGKPIIFSEYFASTTDVDINNELMSVGYIVKSETDRTPFNYGFILPSLDYKNIIGFHWFSFPDIYIANNHISFHQLSGFNNINQKIYNLIDIADS